jgi:hypothetical protein
VIFCPQMASGYFSSGQHYKCSKNAASSIDPGQSVRIILANLTQIKIRFGIAERLKKSNVQVTTGLSGSGCWRVPND